MDAHGVNAALEGFPIILEIAVRWGDMDAFGHVNSVQFFRYFEIARVAYFNAIGFRDGSRIGPILASTSCRFRRPLQYPDQVYVGVRTVEVRDDRFTHEYILFSSRLEAVAARGEGVVVSYDYQAATKAPLPPDVAARIAELAHLPECGALTGVRQRPRR